MLESPGKSTSLQTENWVSEKEEISCLMALLFIISINSCCAISLQGHNWRLSKLGENKTYIFPILAACLEENWYRSAWKLTLRIESIGTLCWTLSIVLAYLIHMTFWELALLLSSGDRLSLHWHFLFLY
jgi:hypothetical protein